MKQVLTGKVLVGMLAVATALLVLTIILIMVVRHDTASGVEPASAAMTIIPAPTFTSLPAGDIPTPTAQATPTLLPGEFGLGVYVQITGTGGVGLRVREEPSLVAQSLFLGNDSEVFKVVDGPVDADGHTWWKLTAPYDSTRSGWAVQTYLVVIQSP